MEIILHKMRYFPKAPQRSHFLPNRHPSPRQQKTNWIRLNCHFQYLLVWGVSKEVTKKLMKSYLTLRYEYMT